MVLPIAFFMLYQTVFETNSNVLMHIVVPRAVREIGVRVVLLALYLMYAFRILSLDGFVIGLCLDYAIAAFINLGYLFSLGRISLKPDLTFIRQNIDIVKSYGLYTGFLIVAALTSVLAPTLSSFFITAQMGLSFTGIFAIATYIAVMVSIPSRSICAIAQPELSAAIKNSDKDSINRLVAQASNNLLLVGGLILLVIWINIDLIFHILPNGETYAVAKHTVLLLGIGQLMVSTFSIFIPLLNYSRYYAFSLLNSAVLTTSAIFFNNMLIPQFGMNGAAFATVIADIIYYILVVGISCTAMRVMPFSRRQLVTLTLIVSLFVVNKLWQVYMPIDNIWFDSIARTIVLGAVALCIIVKAELSPEFHALLSSLRVHRN
jgi:O-antigen/teichoic acid export membrane protein